MVRKDTDYTFRLLLRIASGGGAPVSAAAAAKAEGVPWAFAQKVLRRLVAAGLLTARPGKRGGFALTRSTRDVNMWEVIEAIQGPLLINTCTGGADSCPRQRSCHVTGAWRELQENMSVFLRKTTLAGLLRPKGRPRVKGNAK